MAALSAIHPTLLDVTKRLDPGGKIDTIAEMLAQTNEIIEDAVWIEGNLPTGHRTTARSGLPAPTWRKLYGGVQPTKSRTVQITDSCGMLEAYAEVDKALADLNGNTAAFRLSEDMAHIEGMNQEFSSTLLYGNEGSEPEAFTGFAPRFNSLSAENASHIITSGTTPDTSIWLVVWGSDTVHCIYPKGSIGGLQMHDKGQVTIEDVDGSGGRMEAYRTHYRWDCGLTVRDWRYVVRIMYDISEVLATGATGPVLANLMAKAMRRVPSLSKGRPAFYANRDSLDLIDLQAMSKNTLGFTNIEDAQGKFVTTFRRIPVRRVDKIGRAHV